MKKNKSLIVLLVGIMFLGAGSIILSSCEGPAGPAGVDGNVTCMVCHSDETIDAVSFQFSQSQHSLGDIAVAYAGGRASCAQCHSSQGFIEYARTGSVDANIASPEAWECKTCHGLHKTFEEEDFALRLDGPVAFIFDETVMFDAGTSNLCANCHQSRRAEPSVDVPGTEFEITSTHYGPHHGAQANVVYGAGFAEIAGSKSYPAAGSGAHFGAGGCTACHMGTYNEGVGGHTWNPVYCSECHSSADDDYSFMSVQEDIEVKLEELRDLLVEAGVVEYIEADDAYEPIVGTYPMAHAQAFFNWIGLEEDRSLGVHNPEYVEALLDNSIEAMQAK